MTAEQREMMQRTVGIIEGIAYSIGEGKRDALWDAWEILNNILDDDKNQKRKEKIKMITKISNEVIAELAASSSYKERFIAEYILLKQKHEKLKAFNTKIEAADMTRKEPPKHDCPDYLLREQQKVMGEYLHILEVRAVIESIDLKEAIEALARESIRRASEFRTVDEGEERPCCKSESVPPCEEGIYVNAESPSLPENVIDLDNTIKVFEKCRFGTQEADCDGCILNNNGCVARLDGSVLYHLKSYAKHK